VGVGVGVEVQEVRRMVRNNMIFDFM
jgi:hypothetical protein